ncbi:hypothetical protein ACHAWF_002867 [Thalassiosira exigua]
MSRLLLRSAAAKSPSVASCFVPAAGPFVPALPTSRLSLGLVGVRALRAAPASRPIDSRNLAALRSADDVPADGDGSLASDGVASKKKKSRKQRRATTKQLNLQRVDKILSYRGVASRSESFVLAKARRIAFASSPDAPHEERTRINSPKEKVPLAASLFLDGKLLPGPPPLLIAYHKPKYMLSAMADEMRYQDRRQRRRHLGEVLEPRYAKSGMHPVGRLDYETTGLIFFSMDGTLTQRLLHPRRGIEKEYVATVQGLVDEAELAQRLSAGVQTSEGVHVAKLLETTPSDGPTEDLESNEITGGSGEGEEIALDHSGPYFDVRLVVSEGKHRMVRRMLANCGHPVVELRRERHGQVELGDLKVGDFRELTETELEWAKSLIN